MPKQTITNADDTTPVTGGVPLPDRLVDTPQTIGDAPDDDLGRQLFWLLNLHRDQLPARFRQLDISALDGATKRRLVREIHVALGVAPLEDQMPFWPRS